MTNRFFFIAILLTVEAVLIRHEVFGAVRHHPGVLPVAVAHPLEFHRPLFQGLPQQYVKHWWFSFRKPTYCRMVLCNGACAYTDEAADNAACRLVPLYPILRTSSSCRQSGCVGP